MLPLPLQPRCSTTCVHGCGLLAAWLYRTLPAGNAASWQRGGDPDYLTSLLVSWSEDYNWRPHEERIRKLPWVRTTTDGAVCSILRRSSDPAAAAVVLLHGWPDSVLRFERVLPLLNDLNVVVPALPGYPLRRDMVWPAHLDKRDG